MSYKWQFDIIYADPPWAWKARSAKGEGRSAKRHYPVMQLPEIMAIPVPVLAKDDSVLLLWTIDTMIPDALKVIEQWGFVYKTVGFYWVKTNAKSGGYFTGLGYYTRANPEICLLATKGRGVKVVKHDVARLVVSPRGEHSAKPPEVRRRIEKLFGKRTRRLEMFARERSDGWSAFGNEVEGDGFVKTALNGVDTWQSVRGIK